MRAAFRTVSTLATRGLGSILQLLLFIALGRTAGAALVGAYVLFTNWVAVLVSVWGGGLPVAAMKSFAIHCVAPPATDSHVVKRTGGTVALELAVIVIGAGLLASTIILFIILFLPINLHHSFKARVLLAATFTAAFYAGLKTAVEALKGIRRPEVAFALEFQSLPSVLLVVVGGAAIGCWQLTLRALIVAYAGTVFVSTIVAILLLQRSSLYFDHRQFPQLGGNRKELAPFWLVQVINSLYGAVPYIVLPLLVSNRQIGYFAVAHKLVSIIGTLITVLAGIYGPMFATSAAQRDLAALRRQYMESLYLVIGLALPVLVGLIIFARPILEFFGHGFATAKGVLVVLSAGRLGSAALGLTEIYLNMTGMAIRELYGAIISIILFLAVVYPFFVAYGLVGVAVALSIAFFCRAAVSAFFIRRSWAKLDQDNGAT